MTDIDDIVKMTIGIIFKYMPNQCRQHQEDYEKLLELKREFDEALKAPAFAISATARQGRKQKDWTEAKRLKEEMIIVMDEIEGNIFEAKSLRQLREIALFMKKQGFGETPEELLKRCDIDKENKTVIISGDLKFSSFNGELPDSLVINGKIVLKDLQVKNIHNIYSPYTIELDESEIEEISGHIESDGSILCENSPNLMIISGKLICFSMIDLQNSRNLREITGEIKCHGLWLKGTGLKSLPENMQVHDIFLSESNKELYESVLQRKKEGKITGQIIVG